MPRKGRRSQAAKLRWRKLDQAESPPDGGSRTMETQPPCSRSPVNSIFGTSLPGAQFWRLDDVRADFRARRGTGYRHRVLPWPVSAFTGHRHKLVMPPESPDKKFVLIVGDSHLRAIVDGLVQMPEEPFSFGFMSTPGAAASALRTEVLNAVVPRIPDAVCLLAPSNNLTASRTIEEAAADYTKLLIGIRSRWPNVFVVDFPPRLNCEVSYQDLLRQEYHRVSARMGVRYFSAVEYFPHDRLQLWSSDGVHLSDHDGMGILVHLLWSATMQQLETPPPAPQVSPRPSPPVRKFSPKLVVRGEAPAPRSPDPFQWQPASHCRKTSQPGEPSKSKGSAQTRMAQQQVEECFFPLNPVWFSSTALSAMEEVSPSHLSCPVDCQTPPKHKKVARQPEATARPHRRSPVSNLVRSPPTRMSLSVGDAATPCCSPAAKVARIKTPSPTVPSWTITDTGCDPPSPAKAAQSPIPSSASWPWFNCDAPSTSRSPANERRMPAPAEEMQTKLLMPTTTINKIIISPSFS
ncbi:uncharacterized protein LOC121627123 [Chelmon rostratus]|uniref:uncharacterized protein LOC121627123 n=1 Tax=Chelmon rostratus TaxID=109905 RepID=UPI001BE5137F|nr:uncharacterized protein LOC121627123 [Chelmon rostratus]